MELFVGVEVREGTAVLRAEADVTIHGTGVMAGSAVDI